MGWSVRKWSQLEANKHTGTTNIPSKTMSLEERLTGDSFMVKLERQGKIQQFTTSRTCRASEVFHEKWQRPTGWGSRWQSDVSIWVPASPLCTILRVDNHKRRCTGLLFYLSWNVCLEFGSRKPNHSHTDVIPFFLFLERH